VLTSGSRKSGNYQEAHGGRAHSHGYCLRKHTGRGPHSPCVSTSEEARSGYCQEAHRGKAHSHGYCSQEAHGERTHSPCVLTSGRRGSGYCQEAHGGSAQPRVLTSGSRSVAIIRKHMGEAHSHGCCSQEARGREAQPLCVDLRRRRGVAFIRKHLGGGRTARAIVLRKARSGYCQETHGGGHAATGVDLRKPRSSHASGSTQGDEHSHGRQHIAQDALPQRGHGAQDLQKEERFWTGMLRADEVKQPVTCNSRASRMAQLRVTNRLRQSMKAHYW